MTEFWIIIISALGIGFILRKFVFDSDESEFEDVVSILQEMERKWNGTLTLSKGKTLLKIPYKDITIEVSVKQMSGELGSLDFFYAQFKSDAHVDRDFSVIGESTPIHKPYFKRVEMSDERFREKYITSCSDISFFSSVLTPEIKDKLVNEKLSVRFGSKMHRVIGEKGWLTVFCWMFARKPDYNAVIETAIMFYERFEELK